MALAKKKLDDCSRNAPKLYSREEQGNKKCWFIKVPRSKVSAVPFPLAALVLLMKKNPRILKWAFINRPFTYINSPLISLEVISMSLPSFVGPVQVLTWLSDIAFLAWTRPCINFAYQSFLSNAFCCVLLLCPWASCIQVPTLHLALTNMASFQSKYVLNSYLSWAITDPSLAPWTTCNLSMSSRWNAGSHQQPTAYACPTTYKSMHATHCRNCNNPFRLYLWPCPPCPSSSKRARASLRQGGGLVVFSFCCSLAQPCPTLSLGGTVPINSPLSLEAKGFLACPKTKFLCLSCLT